MLLFQALFSHAFSLYYRAAQNDHVLQTFANFLDKFGLLFLLKYFYFTGKPCVFTLLFFMSSSNDMLNVIYLIWDASPFPSLPFCFHIYILLFLFLILFPLSSSFSLLWLAFGRRKVAKVRTVCLEALQVSDLERSLNSQKLTAHFRLNQQLSTIQKTLQCVI